MTTTRSRDGTLPTRTMEAVLGGFKMRDNNRNAHRYSRGRPRKAMRDTGRMQLFQKAGIDYLATELPWQFPGPQIISRLRTPNYPDELATVVGCDEKPYFGLFGADQENSESSRTRPTAEDRALCQQFQNLHYPSRHLNASSSEAQKLSGNQDDPGLTIHFGCAFTMDAWYRSAYPAEYTRREYLSVCSYCLDYSKSDLTIERHRAKCCRRVPPGREIYRDGDLSMWEVDGLNASLYCQNLCLLTKSFLHSKSLYKDVQPFFFYVLTKSNENGSDFVGYFSKQKMYSLFKPEQPIQSVSCIMSLPSTQSQGYGHFLIDFSYLLAKLQQATGSPETPLSHLGEAAFRSYWKKSVSAMVKSYLDTGRSFSLSDISRDTGIHINHVVLTVESLDWLKMKESEASIRVNKASLDNFVKNWEAKAKLRVKSELLMWTPLYE